jgi:hypothetical protein
VCGRNFGVRTAFESGHVHKPMFFSIRTPSSGSVLQNSIGRQPVYRSNSWSGLHKSGDLRVFQRRRCQVQKLMQCNWRRKNDRSQCRIGRIIRQWNIRKYCVPSLDELLWIVSLRKNIPFSMNICEPWERLERTDASPDMISRKLFTGEDSSV